MATVTVSDTIVSALGTAALGSLTVSWPTYTAATGEQVVAGYTPVFLNTAGLFTVLLYPTPAGVYITATYSVRASLHSLPIAYTEYWTIPNSAGPFTLSQVRHASPVFNLPLQQIDGTGDATGDLIVFVAGTWTKIPVGTTGYKIVADSAQTRGLKWKPGGYAGVGAVLSSGATITPTNDIHVVSGTGAIQRIVVPTDYTITGGGGVLYLIPSGLFTTVAYSSGTDNIALATTAVVGKMLMMVWNQATGRWYPSY